jgi:beta-glucosidase/6-phospho-beta-glucosidase/beta-galactosidase
LRWGPALYRTFTGPGCYDWSWVDDVLAHMRRLRLRPILDLCHFGVPDWLGDFQNPEFAPYFAEYAGAFAHRYPSVRYWTPVNEPLVTTLFSAKYGWWNERLTSDAAYVRATVNVCRATRLAMTAIRAAVSDAMFVQSESCEYVHPAGPTECEQADFLNERRFLPLDLIYGRPLRADMRRYASVHGLTRDDEAFFLTPPRGFRCVLGTDYYTLNEHLLKPDGTTGPAGEALGYYALARQYHERYRLPLMHTETNRSEAEGAEIWLIKQWRCLLRLLADGVPVLGFTWYSLTDQVDWDSALRVDAGRVNPVGLCDLERQPRPVGRRYQQLAKTWAAALVRPGRARRAA